MTEEELHNKRDSEAISIKDLATKLSVSTSTIKNWIRLKYLLPCGESHVDRASYNNFRREVIGKAKLNSRANKLHKSPPTKDRLTTTEWHNYESTLSEAHRTREGIYYTPLEIVEDMLSRVTCHNFAGRSLLDPCCGSGNFLIKAIEMGVAPQDIYVYDIDPMAVEITKQRIETLTGYRSDKIKCADFLEIAKDLTLRVDYIFTNPPWGKKYVKSKRAIFASRYCAGNSTNSSSLFLSASLPLLKHGGQLGFLLQDALFNIGSYADIRHRLFQLNIDSFIDYGQSFKGLMTKAQAIIATNRAPFTEDILCQTSHGSYYRSRSSFACNPQLIYNLCATPEQSEVIEMLFTQRHTTLSGSATWGLGIVTGDNRRFCRTIAKRGDVAIFRGSDITPQGFKSPSLYISPDLSLYQQVASQAIYYSSQKLVYRFISSRLIFICDSDQRLILNSANCLTLNDDFPIPPHELAKFLSSDFMNWLFRLLFSTHKILRSNIESLPIFLEHFKDNHFCEEYYLEQLNIERCDNGEYRCLHN